MSETFAIEMDLSMWTQVSYGLAIASGAVDDPEVKETLKKLHDAITKAVVAVEYDAPIDRH